MGQPNDPDHRPGRPFPYVQPPTPERPAERPAAPAPPVPVVFEPADVDDPEQVLADRRIIFVTGRLDAAAANEAVAKLLALDGGDEPITVILNSPGGPLDDVVPLLDAMAGAASPVSSVGLGQASGSAALALGLASHRRLVSTHSTVCLRLEPETAVTGPADVVLAHADHRRAREARLADDLARRSALPAADILELFAHGHPMSAGQAVELGLADRVR